MKNLLTNYIEESIETLNQTQFSIESNEIKKIHINKDYFNKKFFTQNITENIDDFIHLKSINTPILYWFEIPDTKYNQELRQSYEKYREETKNGTLEYRNTSAYKTKIDDNSTTLYVGKVEKTFWGRLVTHLGYNKSKRTAGMQLFHWYDIIKYGNLELNYIVFDNTMKDLIIILEKKLARQLKPLIGKY